MSRLEGEVLTFISEAVCRTFVPTRQRLWGVCVADKNTRMHVCVSCRSLMYSEANRRETFTSWPHAGYRWAQPDPMAQAGFYHQVGSPNTPF